MIRNENVTVSVGVTQIYPTSVSITQGIGRGYNTCTLRGINLQGNVGEDITVTINGDVHNFILVKKDYTQGEQIVMQCNGIPYTLLNQTSSNVTLVYSDSNTLIDTERGTITVTNNLPNIEFGSQAYSKSATPMERISDMVAVVNGEMYEVNSTLILEELKSISQVPTIVHSFTDDEIFSYSYSDHIGNSVKLKQVLINPITDDIFAEPKITVEYDSDIGVADVYFNPSLTSNDPYSFLGLSPTTPVNTTKVEKVLLSNESQMKTIAGIDTVIYITLDGIPFTSFVTYPKENVVRFLTPITGQIEIKYTTKYIRTYVSQTTQFLIKYKCVKSEGTITIDSTNSINNGTCRVTINTPLTYENGGSVVCYRDTDVTLVFVEEKGSSNIVTVSSGTHAGGGVLDIKYTYASTTWADTAFMNNITSTNSVIIETTSGTVEFDADLGVYLVYIPMRILSINDILEGSVGLVGYSYVDGLTPYVAFQSSDIGRNVDISMNVEITTINIPAPASPHPVTLLDAVGCGGVATQEFIHSEDAMCTIPSTFKIDIADMFSVPIQDAVGIIVSGDGGLGLLTIDSFGKIEVTITGSNLYTIDCGNLKANGRIEIDARGVV